MKVGDLVKPSPSLAQNQALWCRGMFGLVEKIAVNNVATVNFGKNRAYINMKRLEVVSESR